MSLSLPSPQLFTNLSDIVYLAEPSDMMLYMLQEKNFTKKLQALYTVIHLLVVDVACVLFWTQSVCMVPHQNTRNIYHKQMNNGVVLGEVKAADNILLPPLSLHPRGQDREANTVPVT